MTSPYDDHMCETQLPAVFRGMLRDVVGCSQYERICGRLGLVPASRDVDDLEHANSHARKSGFVEIEDDAITYADVAAEVLIHLLHRPDDPDFDEARDIFHVAARLVTRAVISHLLEDGTLHIAE